MLTLMFYNVQSQILGAKRSVRKRRRWVRRAAHATCDSTFVWIEVPQHHNGI